ncbi:DUF4232 domain-containing protein [Streptomyces sp. NPDC046900]|uniref:DUF4232 domain-containing protein n=1 Tax=Streptomyces sp. NPDC046900 TaxID=3155473 RepID=UPI0033FE6FDF
MRGDAAARRHGRGSGSALQRAARRGDAVGGSHDGPTERHTRPERAPHAIRRAPSPANDCATRDLVLTSDKPRRAVLGNPGDVAMDIRLRNRSGINCVLDGWPGVDFVGGKAEPPTKCVPGHPGRQHLGRIDTTSRRRLSVTRYGPGHPTAVRLAPGRSTSFSLVWKSATETVCNGADFYDPPYAADIWVPGDSAPVVVTLLPISPCHGKIGITPFGITGRGPSPHLSGVTSPTEVEVCVDFGPYIDSRAWGGYVIDPGSTTPTTPTRSPRTRLRPNRRSHDHGEARSRHVTMTLDAHAHVLGTTLRAAADQVDDALGLDDSDEGSEDVVEPGTDD